MPNRLPLKIILPSTAIGVVVITVAGGALLWRVLAHYFPVLEGPLKEAPEQPIAFSHKVHVQQAGIDCTFCHREATRGAAATVPSVQQCMFCHQVIAKDRPRIQELRQFWEQERPINWVRVHRLPDHVRFVHEPHLRAGFSCSTCHGDVGSMDRVRQVRSLKMGDCVDCHRDNNAPTDCSVCHY